MSAGLKRKKRLMFLQMAVFVVVYGVAVVLLFGTRAYGAEGGEGNNIAQAAAFIAAGLATGMGAIGTGIAVSSAAAAAIAAISENEQNFGKAMIFVAMAEGIAIYGLLVAFMILGRV
jgi:V/A-type H+-transporting ATPase subunit K